ncbi:unnamed protein product [Trichobilharzia szidati]|nr:unnamed protein product [Trichobilharzia szidati]
MLSFAIATAATVAGVYFYKRKSCKVDFPLDRHLHEQSVAVKDDDPNCRMFIAHIPIPKSYASLSTVCELFLCGLNTSAKQPCLGRRDNCDQDYKWITYDQVNDTIRVIQSSLHGLNIESLNGNHFVGISSKNSPEWIMIELACAFSGYTIVPLYDTLGDEAVLSIVKQTRLQVMFCDSTEVVDRLISSAPESLRHIILLPNSSSSKSQSDSSPSPDNSLIKTYAYEDFLALGANAFVPPKMPKPEDLFMICYTSGSTGIPKGVKITHRCIMNTIQSLFQRIESNVFNSSAAHLSYLPLAHVMEQLVSLSTLMCGARIGFLTDGIQGLLSDLQAVKPTYFFTVPRVLTRLYSATLDRISTYPLLPKIFRHAIKKKVSEQEENIYNQRSIWDILFFNKIKNILGGRVQCIVCGSAPAPTEIIRFTRAVFGCPVLIGYGLTESCGVVSITLFGDTKFNHVGALIPGISVKLADIPCMDICVDKMKMGEVCVKGVQCTEGYYNDEENTKQLIDEDGWLHTGDVGAWNEDGSLKIVDRCKNVFKLSQGEYIAPERLENIYLLSPIVEQIFIDGNSLNNFPVAIVVPNIKELSKRLLAKSSDHTNIHNGVLNVTGGDSDKEEDRSSRLTEKQDVSKLCSQPMARKIVTSELESIGRKERLKGFEIVKAVYLSSSPFTVENGLLTANMKLARPQLRKTFSEALLLLYEEVRI